MKVIVDTCIWSLALRRKNKDHDSHIQALTELIKEYRVQITGPIRQEILSGIPDAKQYDLLRNYLSAFPDLPLIETHYELAADCYNQCRKKEIPGSNTDFLICAIALQHEMAIFTTGLWPFFPLSCQR